MAWIISLFFVQSVVLVICDTTLTLSGKPPFGSRLPEGTTVELQCSPNVNNNHRFSIWSTSERKIQDLEQDREAIYMTLTRKHNRLGLYCRAETKHGNFLDRSIPGSYIIEFSATNLAITQSPPGPISENTEVTLTCLTGEAEPTAVVAWNIGDEMEQFGSLEEVEGVYNAQKRKSVYKLTVGKAFNNMAIECYDRRKTTVKCTTRLDVRFSALAIKLTPSHSGLIAENEGITLTCVTDESNPTADIVWSRNGSSIWSGISVSALSGQYNAKKRKSVLTLITDRLLNGVVYKCSIKKKEDVADQYQLQVKFPKTVHVMCNCSDPIPTGTSLAITCESTGGNPDKVLSYSWIFNPRYEVNSDLTDNTGRQLEIDSVQYTHAGVYTCEADNGTGVGSDSETVLVNFAPQDVSSLQQKNVYTSVNSKVLLNCTVRAYPILQSTNVIISFKGKYILSSDISLQKLPADESLIELTFDPVTESDFGVYEVTVNNGIGTPTVISMRIENQNNSNVFLFAWITAAGITGVLVVVAVVILVVCCIRRKLKKGVTTNGQDNEAVQVSTHKPKLKTKKSDKQQMKLAMETSFNNKKTQSKTSKKQPKKSMKKAKQEEYEEVKITNAYDPEPSNDNQPEQKPYENVDFPSQTDTLDQNQLLQDIYENSVIEFTEKQTYLEGDHFLLCQGLVKVEGKKVKALLKTARDSQNRLQKKYLSNQIACLRKIGQYRSIVETVQTGVIGETSDIGLAMNYYQYQDLALFLPHIINYSGWQTSSERQSKCKDFIIQILEGLAFLETQKPDVLHYKLSAQHVLIDDELKCRLTGFGFTKDVLEREMAEKNEGLFEGIQWKAPEIIKDCKEHTKLSDTWAFGVLLYEIYNLGQPPYSDKTEDQIRMLVKHGHKLSKPKECPYQMYTLMKSCWEYTPKKRPTFNQLLMKVPKDKPQVAVKPPPCQDRYPFPPNDVIAARRSYVNVKCD